MSDESKYLTVEVMKADTPTVNMRTYSKETLEAALVKFVEKSKDGGANFGQIGMPTSPALTINLSEVSHIVEDAYMDGNALMAKIKILNTPMGGALELMKEDIVFRTAGVGNISPDGTVTDYTLVSINAVHKDSAA